MSVVALLALLIAQTPTWAPVPRPYAGIAVERALPEQHLAQTSVVLDAAARALESRCRLSGLVLDAAPMAACGGSFDCRVEVARKARAELLMLVFVDDSPAEARIQLGLWDVARGERLPVAATERVATSPDGAQDAVAELVGAQLAPICQARAWARGAERELVGLPRAATVLAVATKQAREASGGLRLVDLPPEPVELRVEAEDYLAWTGVVSSGEAPLELDLSASPARWARRGLLGVSVAALVGGAATVVIATATADRAVCVRALAGSCAPVWPGSSALDAGVSMPLGFGLVTMGAVGTASAVWDGQPETSWLAAAVGVFLGAAATAVAYGAGS